jgi:hypothetical protein
MGERMRPKSGHHKQEPHRKPSCASRDYWTTQFVGLISIALNRTAALVWNETRNGVQPQVIPRRLVREFDVKSETAVADLEKVLVDLHTLGLLDFEAQSS